VIGKHKCKGHGYSHQYAACDECRHEYCDRHWRACPSCHGSGEGNRWSATMPGTAPDPAGMAKRKAAAPLKPARPQDACDIGLFSDDAAQLDLVHMLRK
jgi:RNA polymerase subunit RPABC4/transcription elongation factor Spt4